MRLFLAGKEKIDSDVIIHNIFLTGDMNKATNAAEFYGDLEKVFQQVVQALADNPETKACIQVGVGGEKLQLTLIR